jgi:DNA-binding response OmpR family regulator
MKLLVVDDLEAVGVIVSEIAIHSGWSATYCNQNENIIEKIISEEIDVLLTDYAMPGKTGLEIAEGIREAGMNHPIILFSAMTSQIDMAKADELGIFKVLDKPLSVKALRRTLSEAKAVQSL